MAASATVETAAAADLSEGGEVLGFRGGSRGPVGGFIASGEQARRRRPVSSTCSDRPGRYREGDERGTG
jgi:hypothetical protein